MENLSDILPAAHLFQIDDIVFKISLLMANNISSNTCFHYRELAQKYQLRRVIKKIHEFTVKNFKELSASEEFFNISQQEFSGYLSSDLIRIELQEIDVYTAAKRWLEVNQAQNPETVTETMRNVRFALIKPERLAQIKQDSVLCNNVECQGMIEEATEYQTNVYTQPLYDGVLNKPRGITGLVMFPSPSSDSEWQDIQLISYPEYRPFNWKTFPVTDVVPEYSWIDVVNVRNFLFVFGTGVESNNYQNFTRRYDASGDTWLDLTPIPRHPMLGVATAHHGQNIFLIGGLAMDIGEYVHAEATNVNDNYMYSIPSNTWMKCDNLPGKCYDSAAAHLDGYIYCNGGTVNNYTKCNKHYAYRIADGKWSAKSSMQFERSCHVLAALDKKLFAMGGTRQYFQDSIEMYDPLSEQWTCIQCETNNLEDAYISDIYNFHNSSSTSFVYNHKIYLVGAYNGGLIFEFHIDDDSKGVLDETRSGSSDRCNSDNSRCIACAFMTLPKLLASSQ